MIDAGLYALLAGAAAVSAISPRVYFMAAPDDAAAYPCSEFKYVGGSNQPTLGTSGVFAQRVELNALGFNAETVADLSAAQLAAVLPWGGVALANGVRVLTVELLNPGTDFMTEQRLFRRMIEFRVLFTL